MLSNRVNESTRRQPRRLQQSNTTAASSTGGNQTSASRRVTNEETASLIEEKLVMHGALDQPTRRLRHLSKSTRTISATQDAPAIDLVRDQFTRLGGTPADRSVLGNTSRCALPAERQAAARARLEQKRIERQKASGRVADKENVRP